jgi:SAM-dependent methyltransferase
MREAKDASSGERILRSVADYYSEKLARFGATPRGVDWNSAESQELRFTQLSLLLPQSAPFSLNDLGCGYGALLAFLGTQRYEVDYRGFDVSADMVRIARERNSARLNAAFFEGARPASAADYSVASGIFNVRIGFTDAQWLTYIDATLDELNSASRRGFAFNCLTRYSDPERRRPDLYYGDPCRFFERCMTRYAPHVSLLHDYGLYEFTIIVRK